MSDPGPKCPRVRRSGSGPLAEPQPRVRPRLAVGSVRLRVGSVKLAVGSVRVALIAALAVLSGLGVGCGYGAEALAPPTGSPAARHGERAVRTVLAIERMRASLVSAQKLAAIDSPREARVHLGEAERRYAPLSARVRARDPALDREIRAALVGADADLNRTGDHARAIALVRALSGQLLEGAQDALLPLAAREDLGLRAQVALLTTGFLRATYRHALASPAGGRERRLGLQRSYGLLARSQIVARGLGGSLGPQRKPVLGTLGGIRLAVWPEGIERPSSPPPSTTRVERAVERVQAGLGARYGL